jgi:hypothetical protein
MATVHTCDNCGKAMHRGNEGLNRLIIINMGPGEVSGGEVGPAIDICPSCIIHAKITFTKI